MLVSYEDTKRYLSSSYSNLEEMLELYDKDGRHDERLEDASNYIIREVINKVNGHHQCTKNVYMDYLHSRFEYARTFMHLSFIVDRPEMDLDDDFPKFLSELYLPSDVGINYHWEYCTEDNAFPEELGFPEEDRCIRMEVFLMTEEEIKKIRNNKS